MLDGLDVHGEGGFDIYNLDNEIISCNFTIFIN